MDIDMNSFVTLDALLNKYPSLKRVPDKDRVKCNWSQHEMPARIDVVEKYVQGKKYQLILKKKFDYDSLEQYKEFLEPSTKKNHEKQLFCKLTWRHLNKEPHHIMRHVEGKRFKRAYARWQECQANGTEYVPPGRRKKAERMSSGNDDDQYVDLSDDEIVIEDDDDDDLSDLYPDFRRLRASDLKEKAAKDEKSNNNTGGGKRKAQASQLKKPKKISAPSSKRMRSSEDQTTNADDLVKPTKTMTLTI